MAEKAATTLSAEDQRLMEILGPIFDKINASGGGGGPTSTSSRTTQSSVMKLDRASAKAMMEQAAKEADFTGKFTTADIDDFIDKFNAKQNEQIARVVRIANSRTTPGADGASSQVLETVATEEYPSFFKPLDFAKDFIWSKINFKDEKTLGAKSLTSLGEVRGLLAKFQLLGVSDADAQVAAKEIAMGKKTIASYTVELQQFAKKEYSNLADRFAKDPTLTTYDIALPVINMLAKTWQVDPDTIKLDNPYVVSYLRPGGADGKGEPPSYNDLLLKAKNDPKYELTTEANENARSSATALARALGAGV